MTDVNEVCVGPTSEQAGQASSCAGCPNQTACKSGAGREVDPIVSQIAERMSRIRHKILVLSGKGGVGKSTLAAQLSWSLSDRFQIGVLDVDICGPSVPLLFGVTDNEVHRSASGWSPVYATDSLCVMSVGFMLQSKTDAVVWRGPRKTALIQQFLSEVDWSDLDFLLIDAPPGTSDEHLAVTQYLQQSRPDGAIIVTTPQEMSLLDVRKEISFCRKAGLPVLGVVENMAAFVCPHCSCETSMFEPTTGGARQMCQEMEVSYLGAVPLDPRLAYCCEKGKSFLSEYPNAPASRSIQTVLDGLFHSSESLLSTLRQHEISKAEPERMVL